MLKLDESGLILAINQDQNDGTPQGSQVDGDQVMADLKVLKQITSSDNSNEGINEPKVAIYVD